MAPVRRAGLRCHAPSPTPPSSAAARRSPPARCAPRMAAGAASPRRAEEGDARRHGPLPGPHVRRDRRAPRRRGGEEAGWAAPRAPLKPVPARRWRMEKPEWAEGRPPPIPAPPSPRGAVQPGAAPPDRSATCWSSAAACSACPPRCTGAGGLSRAAGGARRAGQGATTANAGSLHVQLHAYDCAGAAEGRTAPPRSVAAARPGVHRAVAGDRGARPARASASAPRAG